MMYKIGRMGMTKLYLIVLNLILAFGLNQTGDWLHADEQVYETMLSGNKNVSLTDMETYPTYLLLFEELDLESIPEYDGAAFYVINNNVPSFTEEDKSNPCFEHYSELDDLGRCGVATANLSKEFMPTEPRESIGSIKPSGWHTVKYPELINDLYLYNRCHLIAYSLAGENANPCNLITGTRYMNVTGMLPFENQVAGYIERTDGKVLYRVTPCFDGDDLVAKGVHMEAFSIDDNGQNVCFNVFVYNVQPGIVIDYTTGDSHAE